MNVTVLLFGMAIVPVTSFGNPDVVVSLVDVSSKVKLILEFSSTPVKGKIPGALAALASFSDAKIIDGRVMLQAGARP